jgi:hypothetical protein
VLARLEAVDGLTTAKVDHTGELLRLDVTGGHAVADALMTLRELGYGADELPGAVGVGRWYGRDAVRELSREEGSVIAERVVAAFARLRGMDRAEAERLEAVVAGASRTASPRTRSHPGRSPGVRCARNASVPWTRSRAGSSSPRPRWRLSGH